jgi:hypothetical protein
MLTKVGVAALALTGVLLATEGALRLWLPQRLFAVRPTEYGWNHLPGHTVRQVVPGQFDVTFTYNRWGMKDDDTTLEKLPGVYRIMTLGDSWCENLQVSIADNFDAVLERLLNAATVTRRFEVLNACVYGHHVAQQLMYFQREGARFAPDLVLLMWTRRHPSPWARVLPDGSVRFVPVERSAFDTALLRLRGEIRARSHLAALVSDRLLRHQQGRQTPWMGVGFNEEAVGGEDPTLTVGLLQEANAITAAAGARLYVVPLLSEPTIPAVYQAALDARRIPYADAGSFFEVMLDPRNITNLYLNPAGCRKLAEALFAALQPFLRATLPR